MTTEQKKHVLIHAWYSSVLLAVLIGYLMGNMQKVNDDDREAAFISLQEQRRIIRDEYAIICSLRLSEIKKIIDTLDTKENNHPNI